MKRICLILIVIGFIPGLAAALGLGKLTLDSGLNQPFEARIELLSVTAEELSTLRVRLADIDAFRRAHIERPFILSQLRFQIEETEAGADYIRVYSEDSIREPYLNFLVEANWSRGRLFREYTVLLDPPLYDPYAGMPAATTTGQPRAPGAATTETRQAPAQPVTYAGGFTGTEYGPVGAGETLWSIASRIRPDSSVSIQQMMLALLHTNPEAFINNNINGLKRGQILRMPDSGELQGMGQAEAIREVRSQNSMWEEVRASLAATATVRPVSEGRGEPAPTVTSEEEAAELRLVTAEGEGEGQTGAATAGKLDQDLALATEQMETAAQENQELKNRLSESDGVISDLQRLIQLKDDELAALQEQIAGAETSGIPEEAEELTGEEAAAEPETGMEAPAEQERQAAPAAVVTTPAPAPGGLVDKIKQMVMDNLVPAAGVVAVVIVVIILLVFMSRRRGPAAEQALPATAGTAAGIDQDEVETVFDARHEAAESEAESVTEAPAGEQAEQEAAEASTEFAAFELKPEAAPEEPGPAAAEQPAEFEEEPLAEVNVFLAYEHFDQAEEFVRNAIEGDPENLDFHMKLLEVFYASGNKARYEEEAKVLHDLVNGAGNHWEMATAMWQEMSPNRALFAEPVEGEEGKVEEAAGGMLDLTAAEGQQADASGSEGGLDFDFGAGAEQEASADEGVLDFSAASPEEDILDVTAAVSSGARDQDLLDFTAAVGIDTELPEAVESREAGEDEILDLTTSDEEPVLDITSGPDEDVLDFTSTGEAPQEGEDLLDVSKVSGEDLLDVTSHAEYEKQDMEEDLLDVTSATSAGADSDELLEIAEEEGGIAAVEESNALEFDISGTGGSEEAQENTSDNIIEFDTGSGSQGEDVLTLDEEPGAEQELSIEGEPADAGESEGLEIDFSVDEPDSGAADLELSLDEGSEEPGAEIDLTLEEDASDLSLEASMEVPDLEIGAEDVESGFELELDTGTEEQQEAGGLDMESTVQMPKLDLEEDQDEEDDDEEHTVFVPRALEAQEQSQEDEVATKLDLAKAYVELGDKDSAKGILEEIIADGNEQQQHQARELLKQI